MGTSSCIKVFRDGASQPVAPAHRRLGALSGCSDFPARAAGGVQEPRGEGTGMEGSAPLRAPGQRSCKQHVNQALQSWDKGGDKCHHLLVALRGRGMGRRTLIFSAGRIQKGRKTNLIPLTDGLSRSYRQPGLRSWLDCNSAGLGHWRGLVGLHKQRRREE